MGLSENVIEKFNNISRLIGNTPMVEITFKYKGELRKIYSKIEYYNLTGSIKDRVALHLLRKAYERDELKQQDIIVEATSGNTGISIAAVGGIIGNRVSIFMPNWMSEERKSMIKSLGAEITLVSKEEGGFLGSIEMTKKLSENNSNIFLASQFSNKDNTEAHYISTAPEIWKDLKRNKLKVDGFVAGVGTGGTVMGIGKYLKEHNKYVKVHPLEPLNSPTMTTGYKVGKHRIQGISDEFIPDLIDLNELDEIIGVDDGDAIIMAQKLAREVGLGVGISSGANFLGAILAGDKQVKDAVIVTVFPDDNKKYLSTDLMKNEPIKEGFISRQVELINMKVINK